VNSANRIGKAIKPAIAFNTFIIFSLLGFFMVSVFMSLKEGRRSVLFSDAFNCQPVENYAAPIEK
jgi:hypothetical protein